MVRLRNRAMTPSPPREGVEKKGRYEKFHRYQKKQSHKRVPLHSEIRDVQGRTLIPYATPTTKPENTVESEEPVREEIKGSPKLGHRKRLTRYPFYETDLNGNKGNKSSLPSSELINDEPLTAQPLMQEGTEHPGAPGVSHTPQNVKPQNQGLNKRPPPQINEGEKRKILPPPVAFSQTRIARLLAQKRRAPPPPPTIMEVSSDSTEDPSPVSSPFSSRPASPGVVYREMTNGQPGGAYKEDPDAVRPSLGEPELESEKCLCVNSPETGEKQCKDREREEKGIVYAFPDMFKKYRAQYEKLLQDIRDLADEWRIKRTCIKEPGSYKSPHQKLLEDIRAAPKAKELKPMEDAPVEEHQTEVLKDNSVRTQLIELETEEDPKPESWSPEQDLPEDETEEIDREITARSSNEPTFFHIFKDIPSDPDMPKQKVRVKKTSLRKIKHTMRTMLGSLGKTFAQRHKLRDFLEGNWEIYHTSSYDEPPGGPLNVHHIEKRPVYAYNPTKDRLMLIPDYERVIITHEGLVIRESSLTKFEKFPRKERMSARKVKAKGVPVSSMEMNPRHEASKDEKAMQEAIEKELFEKKKRKAPKIPGIKDNREEDQRVYNFAPSPQEFRRSYKPASWTADDSDNDDYLTAVMWFTSESDSTTSPSPSISDLTDYPASYSNISRSTTQEHPVYNDLDTDYTGSLHLKERLTLQRQNRGHENPLYSSDEEDGDKEQFEADTLPIERSYTNAVPVQTFSNVSIENKKGEAPQMNKDESLPSAPIIQPELARTMEQPNNLKIHSDSPAPQKEAEDIPPIDTSTSAESPFTQTLDKYLAEKQPSITDKMLGQASTGTEPTEADQTMPIPPPRKQKFASEDGPMTEGFPEEFSPVFPASKVTQSEVKSADVKEMRSEDEALNVLDDTLNEFPTVESEDLGTDLEEDFPDRDSKQSQSPVFLDLADPVKDIKENATDKDKTLEEHLLKEITKNQPGENETRVPDFIPPPSIYISPVEDLDPRKAYDEAIHGKFAAPKLDTPFHFDTLDGDNSHDEEEFKQEIHDSDRESPLPSPVSDAPPPLPSSPPPPHPPSPSPSISSTPPPLPNSPPPPRPPSPSLSQYSDLPENFDSTVPSDDPFDDPSPHSQAVPPPAPPPPPLPASNIPPPPPLPADGFNPKKYSESSSQPTENRTSLNQTPRTPSPKSPTPPSPQDNLMDELRNRLRLRNQGPTPFGQQSYKNYRPVKFNAILSSS